MLTHPMTEQLKSMKLQGMLEALTEQFQDASINALSFEERLGLLLDREQSLRMNKLLQSRLRQAKLHISQANLADINYAKDRKIDKKQIAHLATGTWLQQGQNLILTGATGTGKSYIACALAHKACMLGYRAQYWRTTRLLEELELAKADRRYLILMKSLSKLGLLILDDWAMVKLQGNHQQIILDLLDDRYQKSATIITSQLPAASWYEQIQDATFADATLDRMLGGAQIIQLTGPSMRKGIST